MLHISKDKVAVYTVEKPEVHPHAENVRSQVCAKRPQRGFEPEETDRLLFLAKNVFKRMPAHTSCPVHLPTCDVYNAMHADV